MKAWKTIDWDECPECGAGVEVFTDVEDQNMAMDGDDARCIECGQAGVVNVADDDDAWIDWDMEA